jgi:hypothetical protein
MESIPLHLLASSAFYSTEQCGGSASEGSSNGVLLVGLGAISFDAL